MRIWISGGGTAGHVYPALTVLEAGADEDADVLWIGTAGALEAGIVTAPRDHVRRRRRRPAGGHRTATVRA